MSVSGAAASPPVRVAAAGGVAYVGTTSQREDVIVVLSRNRRQVKRMSIDWVAAAARCSNGQREFGSVDIGAPFTRPIRIRRGRFGATSSGSLPYTPGQIPDLPRGGTLAEAEEVRGKISANGARGTFRETVTYTDFAGNVVKKCDTGRLRWKAVQ